MSCVELHRGTLVNTKGLTVEEYCELLCKKHGYEIAYEGDTYAETLRDVDDTYKVLNGELYRCDDIQKTLLTWLKQWRWNLRIYCPILQWWYLFR